MVNRKVLEEIREVLHTHDVVTFLFPAHGEHNNAVALKEFIESKE